MNPTKDAPETTARPRAGARRAGETDPETDFRVTVSKDYLVFSAGHFITYDAGGLCESLHGHNYRVGVTLWGDVNQDAYVYDFVALKQRMEEMVDELDHRMLLPRDNRELELREEGDEIAVTYGERRYVFPQEDVVVLPIPNTTAEMLAELLLDRLLEDLRSEGVETVRKAEVEVEESFGQSGWATRAVRPAG